MPKINENTPAFRAATLGALLARHYPGTTPHWISLVVAQMQTAARAAKAWETRRCNEPMDERQETRGHERIKNMHARINGDLIAMTGHPGNFVHHGDAHASVSLGGDPRGPCASLTIPGQRGDGWGDSFAIF